jgi:hypothetical protein
LTYKAVYLILPKRKRNASSEVGKRSFLRIVVII